MKSRPSAATSESLALSVHEAEVDRCGSAAGVNAMTGAKDANSVDGSSGVGGGVKSSWVGHASRTWLVVVGGAGKASKRDVSDDDALESLKSMLSVLSERLQVYVSKVSRVY